MLVTKHSALIDFLICFPSILSKSAPHGAAGAGFVDNSMVDIKLFSYPYLHAIIGIYKTVKFTTEMDKIVINNCNELYKE